MSSAIAAPHAMQWPPNLDPPPSVVVSARSDRHCVGCMRCALVCMRSRRFIWADSGDSAATTSCSVLCDRRDRGDGWTPRSSARARSPASSTRRAPKLAVRAQLGGVFHGFQWSAGGFVGETRVEHRGSFLERADAH